MQNQLYEFIQRIQRYGIFLNDQDMAAILNRPAGSIPLSFPPELSLAWEKCDDQIHFGVEGITLANIDFASGISMIAASCGLHKRTKPITTPIDA